MMKKINFFNKRDIFVIFIIITIAGILYAMRQTSEKVSTAEIIVDGEVVMTVLLDKTQTFSLSQNENIVFKIQNNSICFLSSDCPDKICVNTGYIKQHGRYAACMPNKTAIRVISDKDMRGNPDAEVVW